MEILTKELCRKIIDAGVSYARKKGVAAEISIQGFDTGATRFGNNRITQNITTEDMSISVRVVVDNRQARLSADHGVSNLGLRRLIDRACEIAAFQQAEEQPIDLPSPQELRVIDGFDAETAQFSSRDRGRAVGEMIETAKSRGLVSAGYFETCRAVDALGNSNGLFAFDLSTDAQASVTMTGKDSSGWAKADSMRVAGLDWKALAARAADTAIRSANPIKAKPGKYTVILEPAAVLDLVSFIWDDFTGTGFVDEDSAFFGKLGKPILGSNISITDDVFHPLQWGTPYDAEGCPRSTVKLVENGVLTGLLYGRRSARLLGAQPTGHACCQPSSIDEEPAAMIIAGGDTSVEEMIKSTKRGLYISRVWYVRDVDSTTKLLTGMTRDGAFMVENGEVTRAIKNLRFNQSIIEALKRVVALGPAVLASGEEGDPQVVPAMKIEGFNFTAASVF